MHAPTKNILKNPPQLIDCIRIPGIDGMIGITSCPGMRDEFVFDLYGENLIDDLLTMRAWGADVVVTLLYEAELHALGVKEIGKYVDTFNMVWLHLPVSNMGILYELAGEEFRSTVLRLCNLLRQGQRVIIHCKDGLGRAGLVAVHLVTGLGVPAEEAISMVRKARPGSLSLLVHENYCRSLGHKNHSALVSA